MQIERINNWLTLLGNAGIIISIIFLAYQIGEANRVSSAQAYQSRAQMGAEIMWTLADSDSMAPIVAEVSVARFSTVIIETSMSSMS